MRELTALREGWELIEADETRLLRQMSIQDSAREWLKLQQSFESQLQQTAALFAQDHRTGLAELQARLGRLVKKLD